MKALVTGGGGFLGAAIVRMLVSRGDDVRSFARGEYPEIAALGVEIVRGDIRDTAAVAAACRGREVVFHVAAKPPPWGARADYESINIGGTQNVLDACRGGGVEHLVYTSTPSVVASDGDAQGLDESAPYATRFLADYPRTKAEAEQLVLAADGEGMRTIALRPHLIWGPGDPHFLPRFVARARSGELRRIGGGDPLVDTVYLDNAATAHLLAADRLVAGAAVHGKPYFISNGEPIGVWTMVDRMLAAAGVAPVTAQVPASLAAAAAWAFEARHRLLGLSGEPRITRFLVHEVSRAHWFDISAARRDLGYEPTISLDDGLARLQTWCRESALYTVD